MRLLREHVEQASVLIESAAGQPKQYFIEGVFMQAGKENRNGRIYPLPILQREVARYVKESVEPGLLTACGELDHPDRKPPPVSHETGP